MNFIMRKYGGVRCLYYELYNIIITEIDFFLHKY